MKLIIFVLFVISCTNERSYTHKELHLFSSAKISGYDPIYASDNYTAAEIGKVYEGLYEFHPLKRPYELLPNLAEELPAISSDKLTYTIKLKKNVFFHDGPSFKANIGREMTASDFIYSIKRLADPKLQAKGWWLLDEKIKGLNEWRSLNAKAVATNYQLEVEGLKALDDYTLQIHLTRPYPQLIYALAMPFTLVVPREAVEHYGKEFVNHPVGTGPFTLKQFEQSNRITYHKNPKYRQKFYPSEGATGDEESGLLKDAGKAIPLVDRIIVHVMVESQPRWLSFQKAKADLVEIPKDNFEQAIVGGKELSPELKEKGINLFSHPMLDVTFIAFNHDNKLFKNLKLRQAMSLAYDRDEANKIFFNSSAMKAQGAIPPGLGGYEPEFKNPYTEFDLDKARKLLDEAGFSQGKGLPVITVEARNVTTDRQLLEHFTKCMDKIGIKIEASLNSWPELVNKVTKRQYQMYSMGWVADYPDAENFLSLLYCPNQAPGANGSNYCNAEFDLLFKKAAILQDSPQRNKLYKKMNELVAMDVPWIFSFHRTRFFLGYAWLRNFKNMEFNHTQSHYLDVDMGLKKNLSPKF